MVFSRRSVEPFGKITITWMSFQEKLSYRILIRLVPQTDTDGQERILRYSSESIAKRLGKMTL